MGPAAECVRILIDCQLGLPVALENYVRAGAGEAVLFESYAFTELVLNSALSDADFDIANPKYNYGQ